MMSKKKTGTASKTGDMMKKKIFEKIPIGVDGFDVISMGGIPKGRTTLVSGTSGSGKTLFVLEFLWRGITEYNENGAFVTFEETPEDICRNVESLGWDLRAMEKQGRLAFVDGTPALDGSDVAAEVGEFDFGALIARILHAIKKVGAKRVAIDAFGSIFSQFIDTGSVRKAMFIILATLKKEGVTAMINSERVEEYGPVARFGVEEFVSDNAILLRNILNNEKRRRTIEILKFRGAVHQKGEYPFTIGSDGITILPLSGLELIQRSSFKRIPTGNKDLDEMCGGGFFRDSIILISGPTGTGKSSVSASFAVAGCEIGERCIYFGYEESRFQLIRNSRSWGVDLEKWEKKGLLKIICCYPESMGPENHLLAVKEALQEFKPARIVIDSLSAMEGVLPQKSFREFVISLTSHTKQKEIAGLFTNTSRTMLGGDSITEAHISTLTDAIVILRYVEMFGEMLRGLAVVKMRGSWHDKRIREFEITDHGMQLKDVFRGVEGIMTGMARSVTLSEEESLRRQI